MEQNKVVGLHKEKHAKTKISSVRPFNHIAQEHMLPVVVHEFVVAGAEFPVVFVKDPASERFQSVVLLGLAARQNLLIKEDKWDAMYVPRVVRNYPLLLVQEDPNSDRLIVAIDEASERVNEAEGFPLFNDDGSESEFLIRRKQQLEDFYQSSQLTSAFVALLTELQLLQPQTLNVTVAQQKQQLTGLYVIDEQKLNALAAEQFDQLRQRGFLSLVYAHLFSLRNIERLVKKAAGQSS